MGILMALMYLPFYVLFSVAGIVISVKIGKRRKFSGKEIFGFFVAPIISLCVVSLLWQFWETTGDLDAVRKIQVAAIAGLVIPFVVGAVGSFSPGFSAGAYFSTFTVPWITIYAISNYDSAVNYPLYSSLCKKAEVVFIKDINPAKSVFLNPDNFKSPVPSSKPTHSRSIGLNLLNRSTLMFVERSNEKQSNQEVEVYEKISINGERKNLSKYKSETKFITEVVSEISSEYAVISYDLDIPNQKENEIFGSRIEIYARNDNEMIAYAQYYWDSKAFRACPDENTGGIAHRFIGSALNIVDDDRSMKTPR